MGGVFGHMSHIYDNPGMTFGQIKDIMEKASAGQLENVTEKTDGQNLFVSYNMQDGTVRAARNKGNLKAGGMDAEALAAKFGGRGALTDAFVNAFRAFDLAVQQFSDEEKLELFGPNTNIFYNAEVMDPANANVINYDTKTFLIHRAGHAEFDRETGKPISSEEGFSEKKAAALQDALERAQEQLEGSDFKVQVNAIRELEALGDDTALNDALQGMDRVMKTAGVSDDDTIADYIIRQWRDLIQKELPDLDDAGQKLIIKRVMNDYYGALEGEGPLRSRGLETRQIVKAIGDPELKDRVVKLIKSYPQHFKRFIFPIESVIHRFAIEILRAVQSAYIIAAGGNEKEVARLQALVGKAIETIRSSGNEEAMEIIKAQLEKLSQFEDDGSVGDIDLSMISSAAEGIVFDYDGHTYKFTGGFAPANQILGLFKYGRKGIPAFDDGLDEGIIDKAKEKAIEQYKKHVADPIKKKIFGRFPLGERQQKRVIAIYPGRFQPMGPHHAETYRRLAHKFGVENTFIATSNVVKTPNSPLNFNQKKSIMLRHGIPESQIVETRNPYQATEITEKFNPQETAVVFAVGKKDMDENPRFGNLGGVTKKGTPAYYKRFGADEELDTLDKHGYIDVAPHVSLDVPGFGEMSGTTLRQALANASEAEFEQIMGWFDPELYQLLRVHLNEMSGMGGGAVAGYAGRAPDVAGSEKKKKRHEKNFLPEEELVNEVMDYLLGISVG
tara:strand:- start:6076 stop:8259 length:2184 start_codon:yes stop_codon:yes gene_type:complete